jgi:Na+-transporting NADH:ubiquinone oxidoreductase subunit F
MTSCTIEINTERRLKVPAGKSLLATLADQKVFLATACGGRGFCGLCRVKVRQGGGPVTERETKRLGEDLLRQGWRLACQVRVESDLSIEVPAEVLAKGRFKAVCSALEGLTYDVLRLRLELQDPPGISFVPGQYIQLRCPPYPGSGEEVSREYSIASDPAQSHAIELIIRRVPKGICTTYCFEGLKVGDPVTFSGPHGDFRLSDSSAPMIFLAGGSGMAPFVSILHHMANTQSNRQATLFFGGNRPKDLYLLDEMGQFEARLPGFRFVPVVAKDGDPAGWTGQTGLVTEAVQRTYSNLAGYEGYLCGPPGMIDASLGVLNRLQIPRDKIYYDRFAKA